MSNRNNPSSQRTSFVGDNLRIMRALLGLSQYQLAEQIGVDQNHISKMERYKVNPRDTTLEKLAAVFSRELGYGITTNNLRRRDYAHRRAVLQRAASVPVYGLHECARRLRDGQQEGPTPAGFTVCPTGLEPERILAMRVEGDAMARKEEGGASFREGDTVILDPDAEVGDGDFCLATDGEAAVFRQVFFEAYRVRLVCLNRNYPQELRLHRTESLALAKTVYHQRWLE